MRFAYRALRWMAVVMPPAILVILGLSTFVVAEGLYWFTLSIGAEPEAGELGLSADLVVVGLAASFALYRGYFFHPGADEEYLNWLSLTPWRFPKPLPRGPVTIVLQDVVVLALLELLLWDTTWQMRLLVPASFLFVVAACWSMWLWSLGGRGPAQAIGYALGATIWILSMNHIAAGVCLLLTFAAARHEFYRSFNAFPWPAYRQQLHHRRHGLAERRSQSFKRKDATLGWPFDVLAPQRPEQLPLVHRLIISGLAGWWLFALLSHSVFELQSMLVALAMGLTLLHCVAQVFRYVGHHAPPINILGRILTGRWLIPSYDAALLPLLYLLITFSVGAPLVLNRNFAWPLEYIGPLSLTTYLVLTNLACPDLEKWRLTCKTRVTPRTYAASKTEFEQL